MKYYDKPIEKIYWSVGEAALIVGVPPSKVRYWLKHFDLDGYVNRSHHRSPFGANRRLTAKDINRLFEIKRLLQVEGLHIWAAKKRIKQYAPA
jgi:DNA-binding transcriptional MerR regulator